MAEQVLGTTGRSLLGRWDAGPSPGGRTFEEELALFERQVRAEMEQRIRRPDGRSGVRATPPVSGARSPLWSPTGSERA